MSTFKKNHPGDKGYSSVIGEKTPQPKSDVLFEALGDIDELSSWLGTIRLGPSTDSPNQRKLNSYLWEIQTTLQIMMSGLVGTQVNISDQVALLEYWIQEILDQQENTPKHFVLPNGYLDIARTVCRRAERHLMSLRLLVISVFSLINVEDVEEWQTYLNRLSDALFIFARWRL